MTGESAPLPASKRSAPRCRARPAARKKHPCPSVISVVNHPRASAVQALASGSQTRPRAVRVRPHFPRVRRRAFRVRRRTKWWRTRAEKRRTREQRGHSSGKRWRTRSGKRRPHFLRRRTREKKGRRRTKWGTHSNREERPFSPKKLLPNLAPPPIRNPQYPIRNRTAPSCPSRLSGSKIASQRQPEGCAAAAAGNADWMPGPGRASSKAS